MIRLDVYKIARVLVKVYLRQKFDTHQVIVGRLDKRADCRDNRVIARDSISLAAHFQI